MCRELLTRDFNLKPPIRALDVISYVFYGCVTTGVSKGRSFGSVDGIESKAK